MFGDNTDIVGRKKSIAFSPRNIYINFGKYMMCGVEDCTSLELWKTISSEIKTTLPPRHSQPLSELGRRPRHTHASENQGSCDVG
jgi:hypothetical protein